MKRQLLANYSIEKNKTPFKKIGDQKNNPEPGVSEEETGGGRERRPGPVTTPVRRRRESRASAGRASIPPGWELQPVCAHLGWACRPSHPPWFSAGPHLGSQASWGPQEPQRLGDYAAPSRFRRCFPSLFPTGSRTALWRLFTLRSGLERLCVRRLRLPPSLPEPGLLGTGTGTFRTNPGSEAHEFKFDSVINK